MRWPSSAGDRGEALGGLHPDVVRDAGEGLAYVKGLAVAVEVAVVLGGEFRRRGHLAAEQAAGERQTHDQRHAAGAGPADLGGVHTDD